MPKLSIITINLNNREGLERTLQSVINQTFTDFEYIIIDGGSTDGSVDVIQSLNPSIPQSFTWISEPDTGIYNAMNKGIKLAKGEYLQFLNSGDWLYSNTVLAEVFALNRMEDILYGDVCYIQTDQTKKIIIFPSLITLDFFFYHTICHQVVFSKRTLFLNDLFNEQLKIVADFDFLVKKIIIENCSLYKLENKIIVYYPSGGISERTDMLQIHGEERSIVLKKHIPQRVLLDYKTLQQLKNEHETKYSQNIRCIMQHPWLWKLVRRFISIMASFAKLFQT